jgi:hypothetical protein
MRLEGLAQLKNPVTIGNRTRDLAAFTVILQSNALQNTPNGLSVIAVEKSLLA